MTTLIDGDDAFLKQDTAGRVWTPPERREALLDEYERSGVSAPAFARHAGIKYPTFAAWMAKRKRSRAAGVVAPSGGAVRWLEAVVGGESCGNSGLVVELPGGARMVVGDGNGAVLAAAVLRHLGGGGC
jgi:hypothetical protein